jgi:hypothetical protein
MDEGPFSVKLKAYEIQIDTFIPEDNVAHPFMSDRVYKGDDRPDWFKFGDSRTREWLKIIGPAATVYLIDEGPYPDTGPSSVYEASSSLDGYGRLTGEALSDWVPGSPLKIDWDQASASGLSCSSSKLSTSEMRVSCDGNAANPLVWSWAQWGASITYHLEIHLTFSGDGNVYYEVTGDHDGFPNYGIWVGDQRIYDYYHGSQTPWSLGPPMEMPAYRSGVLQ